jgi:hypothetical protein
MRLLISRLYEASPKSSAQRWRERMRAINDPGWRRGLLMPRRVVTGQEIGIGNVLFANSVVIKIEGVLDVSPPLAKRFAAVMDGLGNGEQMSI